MKVTLPSGTTIEGSPEELERVLKELEPAAPPRFFPVLVPCVQPAVVPCVQPAVVPYYRPAYETPGDPYRITCEVRS